MHSEKIPAKESNKLLKVLIVIPTYNNRNTLRTVVEESIVTGLDVLVVNDGSTDGALELVQGMNVSRIDFTENRGKGQAIKTAADWADQNKYSHIITIDADGQHIPGEALKFVKKIEENPQSIILGVRNFEATNTPGSSQFGRKFSNFWVKVSTGLSVKDSQSGFRAYPVEALKMIKCYSKRYNYEVEILVKGAWAGLAIQSVDITVHYTDETISASHFRPFLDNARISMTYTYLVTRNLFPWPHKILFGPKTGENFKVFFLNPFKSLKLLFTEKSSPKEIVFAVMIGIFIGTLPIFAMHSIVIVFVATRLKLNRLIALNVSHICAPPFVPAMAVELGYFIRNGKFLTEFNLQTLGHEALQRFGDYIIGAILLAPVLGLLAGLITYLILKIYRRIHGHLGRAKEAKNIA